MKKLFSLITFAFLAFNFNLAIAQLPSYLPTNGLAAWYPFNGNANDESGNGNNGTVNGATLTNDRFGEAGKAYSFNGNGNYITVPYSNTIGVQNNISVSVWILMDGGSCNPRVFEINSQYGSCGGYCLISWGTSNVSRAFSGAGLGDCTNGIGIATSPELTALTWHHIAYTINSTTQEGKLYFDGQLVQAYTGTSPSTINYNGNPLTIGNINPGRCDWWGGKIDDMAIYNRALTQQEITSLYTGQSSVTCTANITQNDTTICSGSTLSLTATSSSNNGVTDVDGNYYPSINIGNQTWMQKNLNVTRYRNGDPIPQVTSATQWANLTTGAWCWYNNDSATYAATYGKLYNWYAVNDPRVIAPDGWRVPNETDWNRFVKNLDPSADTLCFSCIQSNIAGGAMKSTSLWESPNVGATNSSGFLGLPGGFRVNNGQSFSSLGFGGVWWSSNEFNISNAWSRHLSYLNSNSYRYFYNKTDGYSVRLISNQSYSSPTYLWSNGDTTATISVSPTTTTTYYCMVTDTNGASCIDSVRITVNNCNAACLPSYLPTNGLVGYWPFCGNANDESGNGNNGTVNGATLTTDRFGEAGKAYSFDGVNDYIMSNGGNQFATTSRTVSYWLVADPNLFGELICLGSPASTYWGCISANNVTRINYGRGCFESGTYLSPVYDSSSWYHITFVTLNDSNSDIYINGNYIGQITHAPPSSCSSVDNLYFGVDIFSIPEYHKIKLDDIAIYNRALSAQEIAALYAASAPANSCTATITPTDTAICRGSSVNLTASTTSTGGATGALPTNLQTGLVGYWPFNGNANDESGNGNNGTVNGATLTTDRIGIVGKAYSFNGNGNNILLPENGSLLLNTGDFTINAWVLPLSSNSNHIFYKGQSSGNSYPKYTFTLNSNKYAFHVNGPGLNTGVWNYSNSLVTTDWHMATIVKSGTNLVFYHNATNDNQSVLSAIMPNTNGFNAMIGGAEPNGSGWFNGKIDDIAIWNRALTASEIQQLYNSQSQTPTYLWSTGATTPTISVSPTASTTYYCTITDGNGNTCTDSVRVTVNTTIPPTPRGISGLINVCAAIGADTASAPVTYTVIPVAGAIGYTWTLPANCTLLSGQGTDTIRVRFSSSYTQGIISVKAINGCGVSSVARGLTVTKREAAQPGNIYKQFVPVAIPAVTAICNTSSEVYRIVRVNFASSFIWSLRNGTGTTLTHLGTPGINDTAVSIAFTAAFQYDTLSVRAVTACNVSPERFIILNRSAQTAAIRDITATNNNFTPCIGDSISYTAVPNPVAINQSAIAVYRWVLPAGVQVLSATTDSQRITLRFLSTFNGGLLSVKGASSCGGLGAGKSYYFRYWAPIPVVTSGTGALNACPGDAITYTATYTTPLPTSQRPPSVYSWTLPTGASISSANSDSSVVTIQYGTAFRGGSLIIRSQTNCGVQSIDRRLTITNTGCVYCNANITTADTTICAGDSVTLTATVTGNAQQGSGLSGTLLNGLVGYWPFNGNANDESGNGNNGTVNGATLTTDRFGNSNAAFEFSTINGNITLPSLLQLSGKREATFAFWRKNVFKDEFGYSVLFEGGNKFKIFLGSENNFLDTISIMENYSISREQYNSGHVNNYDSIWNYITIVFDGTGTYGVYKIFQNGQYLMTLDSWGGNAYMSDSLPIFNTSDIFYLKNKDLFSSNESGSLDDFIIYNRMLSASEISQLYTVSTNINFNYQWSNGATTPSIRVSPSQATTYTCTVTSNGATCIDSVTVSVNNNCATSCIADIVNNDTTICAGQPVTLTATTTATVGSGLSGTLQNGLVGYWPFNGNANDESGNGNNGTVNGATLTTDRFGNAGKAYNFDGVNQSIIVNNSNSLNPNSITISIWYYPLTNDVNLISKTNTVNPTKKSYRIVHEDFWQSQHGLSSHWGSGNCETFDEGVLYGTQVGVIPNNSWNHVVVTISSSGLCKHYFNGNLIEQSQSSPFVPCNDSISKLNIGGIYWVGEPNWYNGKIDEIAIWNRALTPQEIQQLYTGVTTNGVTDIDGNNYPTVNIGTQTWTQKNLNASHYRNGDVIPQVTDPTTWANLTTGAWCWYNNDSASYAATYGKLYNWYAVNDPRGLAPQGWHVPSDGEWNRLVKFIDPNADTTCILCDQNTIAGNAMKEAGVAHWDIPNLGATNSSGFTSLPGGVRYQAGNFSFLGYSSNYWATNSNSISTAFYRNNVVGYAGVYRANDGVKMNGLSVRCLRDATTNNQPQTPNYQWSTGATTPTITVNPTQTTTYYCTVSYGNVSCVDSVTVTVNANVLSAPLAISGAEDICPLLGNDTATAAVPYTCTPVTGAATYNWTMPAGATLLSGQGTRAITVRFSSSYTGGNISVVASNSCAGNSEPRTLFVAKLTATTPVSFVTSYNPPVAAVTNVCNINSQQYMTRTVRYATGYLWSMSNGALAGITHINPAGVNDTAVIVNFASGFVSDTLNVRALTACSVSEPRQLGLLINQPTAYVVAIANAGGNFSPCIGDVISYSATASSPQVGQSPIALFRWTLSPGAVIVSANADSSNISVSFTNDFNGGVISVRGQSACGGLGTPKTVYFRYYPPTPSSITASTGSFNACIGDQVSYTVLLGAIYTSQRAPSVYRWTLPAGASIVGSNTDSSTITVQFNTGYRGGSLSVRGVTACGVVGNPKTQGLTNTGCRNSSNGLPYTKTPTVLPSGMQVILNPNPTVDAFRLRVNSGSSLPIIVTVSDSRLRLLKRFEVKPGATASFGNDLIPGVYMIEVMQGEERKVIRGVRM